MVYNLFPGSREELQGGFSEVFFRKKPLAAAASHEGSETKTRGKTGGGRKPKKHKKPGN